MVSLFEKLIPMAQSHPRDDIKVELKRLGLTQAWLARRAGVNTVNLSRWLDGTDPHDASVWDELLAAFPESPIVGEPKIPVGFQMVKIPHDGMEMTYFLPSGLRKKAPNLGSTKKNITKFVSISVTIRYRSGIMFL
jgi:lambda repressor-like predicted transcriptional regulator